MLDSSLPTPTAYNTVCKMNCYKEHQKVFIIENPEQWQPLQHLEMDNSSLYIGS